MFRLSRPPAVWLAALCAAALLGSSAVAVTQAADGVDLSGTFKGLFVDKGRNVRQANMRLRMRQDGDRLSAEATDNTMWITGLIVENKVFLEWEHASGERGEGVWDILEGGNRVKGTWESKGSGHYYGDWDLRRQ